ncbi:rhamnogalacturonan acetylesterase protein [Rutstroemia sp. NJR-2017a BBW]|nr:rhamnogalacturonan acetylesterase protein [Rutstroemia sp. NJR-2017a BBW]
MQLLLPLLSLLTATTSSSAQTARPQTTIRQQPTFKGNLTSPLKLPSKSALTLSSWGYYIHNYLSIGVSNLARNGRSTRSFINEGRWASLLNSTNAGDYVIIEMGHNDDGDPTTNTADRATLPGIGNDSVVVTTSTGASETVYSFGWYLRKMIVDVRAKDATPILSGMVPRNYWKGNTLQSTWPFAVYAQEVAAQTSVAYVDHTKYAVNRWQALGPTTAKTYYPNDNTHTNPAGAQSKSVPEMV